MRKVYVEVNADHSANGKVIPNYFVWEDGQRYEIDRVIDVRRAASLKAGGIGYEKKSIMESNIGLLFNCLAIGCFYFS